MFCHCVLKTFGLLMLASANPLPIHCFPAASPDLPLLPVSLFSLQARHAGREEMERRLGQVRCGHAVLCWAMVTIAALCCVVRCYAGCAKDGAPPGPGALRRGHAVCAVLRHHAAPCFGHTVLRSCCPALRQIVNSPALPLLHPQVEESQLTATAAAATIAHLLLSYTDRPQIILGCNRWKRASWRPPPPPPPAPKLLTPASAPALPPALPRAPAARAMPARRMACTAVSRP